jgi:lipid A biosynthesis lauroyl/palmitoleoyl acyltransferase
MSAPYVPVFEPRFLMPRYWGTWLLLGVLRLAALLPLPAAHALGAALGEMFHAVNAKRRRIARINIGLCFPELGERERCGLVRRHFRTQGKCSVDLGLIWWAPVRRLERLIRPVGLETYQRLLAEGRNVIMLTGHFCTADLGGIYVSRFHPGLVMMKRLRNPVINWFVWRGRTRFGAQTTLREQGLRPLVRAIRAQVMCYYVPDEDFGPTQSVFVPLLGTTAATVTTLGRLAATANAVVMPCFTRMLPDNRGYELIIRPPLEGFPTGDRTEDARRMNQALEEGIRMMPEQYMWTMKWFRSRPEGEASPYGRTEG